MRPTIRTKKFNTVATGLVVTALFLGAGSAWAQESSWGRDHGWSVGLQFLSDHIGAEDPGAGTSPDAIFVEEGGGGVLLHGDYAFTPSFALRFSLAGARHKTSRDGVEIYHGSATLEAHLRFLPGERAQPFLFGGVGGANLEFDSDTLDSRTRGGLAVLGAGVMVHLTRHLSMDFTGRLDLINWDTVEVTAPLPGGGQLRLEDPVDESGSALKVLLGLAWNF